MEFAPYFSARHVEAEAGGTTMQLAYALRYSVYCKELQFLDAGAYPDELERDAYDAQSAHFCSFNLKHELAGYVRLVSCDGEGRFPWQNYCTDVFEDVVLPSHHESAEISRLMVRSDYRRRRNDLLSGVALPDAPSPDSAERRTNRPQILLTLYRQMYKHSLTHGIRYWHAAMEQLLARSLQLMSFPFKKMGRETDYFGPVAPYLIDLRALEQRLEQANPVFLAWLQQPDHHDR
jgi:N-acyl amino acid synthase of PEP-CTERM/exosortase system